MILHVTTWALSPLLELLALTVRVLLLNPLHAFEECASRRFRNGAVFHQIGVLVKTASPSKA